MLTNFFRSRQIILIPVIVVMGLLLWLPALGSNYTIAIQHEMPLFELFAHFFVNKPLLQLSLAFLLVVAQAFLFNSITEKHELFGKSSYLPALIYVIIFSFTPDALHLHPLLFANFFILLSVDALLNMYRKPNAIGQSFETGLFIAIATLFYFPSILLLLFLLVGLFIMRPFSIREFILILLGFIFPYLYVVVYYFFIGKLDYLWFDKAVYNFIVPAKPYEPQLLPFTAVLLFTAVFFILSIGRGNADGVRNAAQYRSSIAIFRWLFLFGALSLFLAPAVYFEYGFIALIPLSIIWVNYFLFARFTLLSDVLFILLFVMMVYFRMA